VPREWSSRNLVVRQIDTQTPYMGEKRGRQRDVPCCTHNGRDVSSPRGMPARCRPSGAKRKSNSGYSWLKGVVLSRKVEYVGGAKMPSDGPEVENEAAATSSARVDKATDSDVSPANGRGAEDFTPRGGGDGALDAGGKILARRARWTITRRERAYRPAGTAGVQSATGVSPRRRQTRFLTVGQ
jgi:hypothetical protein